MRYVALALLLGLVAAGLYWLRDDDGASRAGDRKAAPEEVARWTTAPPAERESKTASSAWRVVGSVTPKDVPEAVVDVLLLAEYHERILASATVENGMFAVELPQLSRLSAVQRHVGQLAARVVTLGQRPGRSETVPLRDREPGEVRLDVTIESGGTVTGRVVDRFGKPVRDAEVWFSPKAQYESTSTGPDGRYWLPIDDARQYWICARRGDLGAAVAGPFHITEAGLRPEDLVLAGPGALTGVAVHPDGTPARHLMVHAVPESLHGTKIGSWPVRQFDGSVSREAGLSWGWMRTGLDGRFAITGLQQGRYWFKEDAKRTLHNLGSEVRLVIEGYRIRVYVRDDEGEPAHGYTISARSKEGSSMAGNTSEDAMVDIGARVGESWVITLGSRTIQPVAARVTVREGTYDYEVVLPVRMARERGQLEVTLNDPQGEPIPKSHVSLYTLDGDVIVYEKPLDGSRTPLVPAGRYRIVGHPGGPFALYLPAEGHVDVRGDRVEQVTLTARPGGRLRFTFKTDLPLKRVRIKATPQQGAKPVWLNAPLYSLENGGFRWGGRYKVNVPVLAWQRLEPGPWKLEIEPTGFLPRTIPVTVLPGEIVDVDVELEPAPPK